MAKVMNMVAICMLLAGTPASAHAGVPIPVLKSSYENKVAAAAALGAQVIPTEVERSRTVAFADFFRDGTYSMVVHSLIYDPTNPSTANQFGKIIFYKSVNGAWVDLTAQLLTNTIGCLHPRKAVVADFNGDGVPDVFFSCTGFDAAPGPGEQQHALMSQSDGTYQNITLPFTCYCHGASAMDTGADGFADVLVTNATVAPRTPFFLLNNRNGTFRADLTRLPSRVANKQIYTAELIDFDGAGNYDVFLGGSEPDAYKNDWVPTIFKNDGSNHFTTSIDLPTDPDFSLTLDVVYVNRVLFLNRVRLSHDASGYGFSAIQRIDYKTLCSARIYSNTSNFLSTENLLNIRWIDWIVPHRDKIVGLNALYKVSVPQSGDYLLPAQSTFSGTGCAENVYLYGNEIDKAVVASNGKPVTQTITYTTTLLVSVNGTIINGRTPSITVQVNGKEVGTKIVESIPSPGANCNGTPWHLHSLFSVTLPGIGPIDSLKLAISNPEKTDNASCSATYINFVTINGEMMDKGTFYPIIGPLRQQTFGNSGNAFETDNGYVLVDASSWNSRFGNVQQQIGTELQPILVDGGGGIDTVHVLGRRSDYSFSGLGTSTITLSERSGLHQNAVLSKIANIAFQDGTTRALTEKALVGVLDIDRNGTYDALTDGLLALRYMFGLTGSPLSTGVLGDAATRTDPAVIKSYLDSNRTAFDIDGNGTTDALTDGLLILRYLFGLRGAALTAGAVDPVGSRNTAPSIEAYIESLIL